MAMIMEWCKPNAYNDTTQLVPVKYKVLVPGMMIIRNDKEYGNMLYGFGIGDIIEVMEPSLQDLACRNEVYDTIPLSDGTEIIAYDSQMQFEMVYPQMPYKNTLVV